jgi:hypothetical protein
MLSLLQELVIVFFFLARSSNGAYILLWNDICSDLDAKICTATSFILYFAGKRFLRDCIWYHHLHNMFHLPIYEALDEFDSYRHLHDNFMFKIQKCVNNHILKFLIAIAIKAFSKLELTNHKFHQSIYYKLSFFITRNKPKTHIYIGGGPPERNTCILKMILQIYPHYIHIAVVYPLYTTYI